jgi:16S rRNA (cytosine967-C5)-methyltransferase
MTPAARIAAAIEIVGDIEARRRPAADTLKDWGLSHRFAGSGDRAGIAGLVYDALRRRASSAYVMGEDKARAIVLGMLRLERGLDADAISAMFDGARYAPEALNEGERAALTAADLAHAPAHIAGDYPQWLDPHLARVFGDDRKEEGAALSSRAPLDLRVNTLKAEREQAAQALADLKPEPARWSPVGLRIRLAADAKNPSIHAEKAFIKGQIEIQDEGSQLAALLAGAKPGEQVVDLCAGAGGKTLALAAAMENKGQIHATDTDKRRLAPIHDRLARSGARNVQVIAPRRPPPIPSPASGGGLEGPPPPLPSPASGGGLGTGQAALDTEDVLADLHGRIDLVLIDAPCTGTGAWRRNPDAKWRLRPGALEIRGREQAAALDRAVPLLKATGRIAYVTCSVLEEENGAQVRDFLTRHPQFSVEKPTALANALGERGYLFQRAVLMSDEGLLMTPRRTDTDGFFVCLLRRAA